MTWVRQHPFNHFHSANALKGVLQWNEEASEFGASSLERKARPRRGHALLLNRLLSFCVFDYYRAVYIKE
jgi:hypothetical protein